MIQSTALVHEFLAIEEYLLRHLEMGKRIAVVQIGIPSTAIREYQLLEAQIHSLVTRINKMFIFTEKKKEK